MVRCTGCLSRPPTSTTWRALRHLPACGARAGTNSMFWVATPAVRSCRGDVGDGDAGPFWSMLTTLKISGNLPSALRFAQLRSAARPSIRPMPPWMKAPCWPTMPGAAERLQRLKQRGLQFGCGCLRHRDVPHDRCTAGASRHSGGCNGSHTCRGTGHHSGCCHAGNEGFQGHDCPFDRPNSPERLTVLLVCRIPRAHTKAESPVALKLLLHQLPVRGGAQHE